MFQLSQYTTRFFWRPDRPRQLSFRKPIPPIRFQKPVCASDGPTPVRVDLEDGSILFKFDTKLESPAKSQEEVISELKEVQKQHDLDHNPDHKNSSSFWKREDLTALRVRDLRELCRKHEIRGFSALKKADLIDRMLLFETNGARDDNESVM